MSLESPPDSLAIETSTRDGSITVGRGDAIGPTVALTQQRRHNLELMPAIAALCDPRKLREVYVNVGPGSFTGLRIAIAAAKMLALSLDVKLVAIEAVDVLAQQATEHAHLAVCLNHKRGTVYTRFYRHGNPIGDARLTTMAELFATPRPLALLGDLPPEAWPPRDVTVLPPQSPRSETVWRLGRAAAKENRFADPATILPRYARPPEAVILWQTRKQES